MTEAERPEPQQPEPPKPPSPMDILRDPRALVDTGLGPVAFITVNALTDLETAAIVAIAFWGSIAFRRPLVGFIVAPIYHFPSGWYRDRRIRRAFSEGTAAFALVFSVRAVVYTVLIVLEREGALAGAVVVLGWPAFLGALWFCYRYIPRRLRQLGVDPDSLRQRREH